jgi:hypothetical protein
MSILSFAKSVVVAGMISQAGAQNLRGGCQVKDTSNNQQVPFIDSKPSADSNLVTENLKSQLNIEEVPYQCSESFVPDYGPLHDCDYSFKTNEDKFESRKGKCNEDRKFVSGVITTDKGYVVTGNNFDSNGEIHGLGSKYYGPNDEEHGCFNHGIIIDGVIDLPTRHTEGHYNIDRRLDDKNGKEVTQTSSGNLQVNTGGFSNGEQVSGSSDNFGNDSDIQEEIGNMDSVDLKFLTGNSGPLSNTVTPSDYYIWK